MKVIGPAFGAVTTRARARPRLAHRRRVDEIEGLGAIRYLPCTGPEGRVTLAPMAGPRLRSFMPRSLFGGR